MRFLKSLFIAIIQTFSKVHVLVEVQAKNKFMPVAAVSLISSPTNACTCPNKQTIRRAALLLVN